MGYRPPILEKMQAASRERYRAKIKHNVISVLEEREEVMQERSQIMTKQKELTCRLNDINDSLTEEGITNFQNFEPGKPFTPDIITAAFQNIVKDLPPIPDVVFYDGISIPVVQKLFAKQPKTAPVVAPPARQQAIIPAAAKVVPPILKPKKEDMPIKQMPLHVPHSGPTPREIKRVPMLPDYSKKQSFVRPKAEYDNHKSFYGVYAELQKEWLKKSG